MVRNVIFFGVLLTGLLIATAFAALNPGTVKLDLAFFVTEIQKSLALTVAFGLGWVFGLLCTAAVLLRSANERRKLRKSLGLAEAEVNTLRNLPINDAD